jgi:hypothetical protein
MPDGVLEALLNLGILGPVLVAAGLYVTRLHKDLKEVQEKRTSDAQAVVDRVLALAKSHSDTSQLLNQTLTEHGLVLAELRDALRSMANYRAPGGGG